MDDRIDANAEIIPGGSYRASMAVERQRDIDVRMASHYSTSTELGAYDIAAVREMYRHAR